MRQRSYSVTLTVVRDVLLAFYLSILAAAVIHGRLDVAAWASIATGIEVLGLIAMMCGALVNVSGKASIPGEEALLFLLIVAESVGFAAAARAMICLYS